MAALWRAFNAARTALRATSRPFTPSPTDSGPRALNASVVDSEAASDGRQRTFQFQHHDESRVRFEVDRLDSASGRVRCLSNGGRVVSGDSDESVNAVPVSSAFVRRDG